MTHRRARYFMDLALDEELPEHVRPAFHAHLATCDACRAEYQRLRRIDREARALADTRENHEPVLARIEEEVSLRRRRVLRFGCKFWLLLLASLFLRGLHRFYVGKAPPPPPPSLSSVGK